MLNIESAKSLQDGLDRLPSIVSKQPSHYRLTTHTQFISLLITQGHTSKQINCKIAVVLTC